MSEMPQPSTPEPFGQLLKRLRLAADLTQEELAERAGISARGVSDLERGLRSAPRRDTVQLLADALGLSGSERDAFVGAARGRLSSPPPASLPRFAVPLPPTPLVDRLKEMAATTALLLQPDVRLLTLTGPGGVGKTRLALEAAARVQEAFPDGVCFVELAPLGDPALVLPTIAHALGVRDDGESGRSLSERVVDALAQRHVLLVLDNLEHLTTAATAIASLLAACPTLTVLATSREPLHLRVEHVYEVLPLALPDLGRLPPADELARVPAVDLFIRRAEAAYRGFALTDANAKAVAEIAVKVDGLPLALELAAARVRVLSPAALLSRLRHRLPLLTGGAEDLPARQQTLRATIAWSHDLLGPDERDLFRRLAVFVGGFTLAGAEAVGGAGFSESSDVPDVLDLVTALIDKSLIAVVDDGVDERRFGMLETIREFGLESLEAAGEGPEIRNRHAAWCLDLTKQAEPELNGPRQSEWFARLDAEHDNLRAALGWAVASRDAETALLLCGTLLRFWVTGGHFDEGRRWFERSLALEADGPPAAAAKARLGAGVIAYFQGDYETAASHAETAQVLYRQVGDKQGVASSYGNLGLVADARGDYERAATSYGKALELFRELDDQVHANFMLGNLGLIAYFQGDYERATVLLEEAIALGWTRGDRNSVAISLGNLGLVACAKGDYAKAIELEREALSLRRQIRNDSHLARIIENFAFVAAATGDSVRAVRLFSASEALRQEIGIPLQPNDREVNERAIEEVRARLSPDAFAAAWDEGQDMPLDEVIAYALDEVASRSTGSND